MHRYPPNRIAKPIIKKAFFALFWYSIILIFWDWSCSSLAIWSQYIPSKTYTYFFPSTLIVFYLGLLAIVMNNRDMSILEYKIWLRMNIFYLYFLLVIIAERIAPSPWDNDIPMGIYLTMLPLFGWTCIGFRLGNYSDIAAKWAGKLANFLAFAAIPISFMDIVWGAEMVGGNMTALRLSFLFAFFWFLYHVILSGGRSFRYALIGFMCTSLEIILPLHKPIVWSAAWGAISMMIILFLAGQVTIKRSIRTTMLVLIIISCVVFANNLTGGELFQNRKEHIYKRWFHLEKDNKYEYMDVFLERSSGGRFDMWKEAWPRFIDSPFLGSGFHQLFYIKKFGGEAMHLHNFFLDVFLGVGIFGAIPVFAGLCIWFRNIIKTIFKRQTVVWFIPFTCYCISILTYSWGGNFILFYFPSVLLPILIGMTLRQALRIQMNKRAILKRSDGT